MAVTSPGIANGAVLKCIGRLEAITPVTIQVAMKSSEDAVAKSQPFNFSRVCRVPRLVMDLSSSLLALNNISFLMSDATLATDDILFGLPALRNLQIDSRTLLERNSAELDGTDCSSIRMPTNSKSCGTPRRLMIARLHRVYGTEMQADESDCSPSKPHVLIILVATTSPISMMMIRFRIQT